jgi:hypothetical protein
MEESPSVRVFNLANDKELAKWYSADEIEDFKAQVKYHDICIGCKIASCPSKTSNAISI